MSRSAQPRVLAILAMAGAASLVVGFASDSRVGASMRSSEAAVSTADTTRGAASPRLSPAAPGGSRWISVAGEGRFTPQREAGDHLIELANGIRIDTGAGEPPLPEELRREVGPGESGYFILQFAGPIEEAWKQEIEAIGGRLFAYLPHYAFIVRLPAGGRELAGALKAVRWVGIYQPAYKLSAAEEMRPGRAAGDYVLQVFDGEPVAAAEAAVLGAGGAIQERSRGRNQLIRFRVASTPLAAIAGEPSVAWIEPWRPLELLNGNAQWVVQTFVNGNRRVWDMGIRGEGQVVSTSDTGIRTSHQQFSDVAVPILNFGHYPTHRKVIAYVKMVEEATITFGDEPNTSYHGTHTGGTIAGDDSPSVVNTSANDGMALKAKIFFCDGGGVTFNGIAAPVDLNDLFILPYTGNGGGAARIMANSWGSPVTAGDYDFRAMTLDQFMWDHKDFLAFFANGNNDAGPTVFSPATAKDCVSVGATQNGTSANIFATFTSIGPAADGRLKPTLCTPGSGLVSADGASDATYVSKSGTSMATPAAAGATALLRQYCTEGWYPTGAKVPANGFTPSAALLKAMAVNSADPNITGQTIPNNRIGWGRIRDDDVLFFTGDARKTALVDFAAGLLTGEFVEFQLEVVDGAIPLEATLVWTDFASTPAASINLVNDLNLSATDGATTYLGNVYSGGQSATGGSADAINVEECVQRNSPALGLWTFRIEAVNVPYGPQPFALVVTGGLAAGSAIVQVDQATYGAGDVVGIRVTDANAGGSPSVTVSSDTEPAAETVALTGGNGIFTGSIPVSLDAAAADGEIQVSDGDIITVIYNDPGPVTAQALVNLSGPAITNVHASTISQDAVTITWLTSSPANSKVYYGTTPSLGLETALDPDQVSSHAAPVSGLAINQTYYFDVESFDNQGNGVRDSNGGLLYTFTTDPRKDVLLVIANDSFDKRSYYENALGARGWAYTVWEGAMAEPPRLGNLTQGLRSFKAMIWQVGLEQYPAITDAARDTLAALGAGGARWSIWSHDVAWDFSDPTSPDYAPDRQIWFQNELKAIWQADPATFSQVAGVAGDPISGAYTGGISYTPHRNGAAGDEIDPNSSGGGVTAIADWRNNDTSPDDIAVRFTGSAPVGNPADAVWGGQVTKIASNFWEWAHVNVGSPNDATRADILDKTLIWLIGHDHPDVTVSAPNGGQTFTSSPVSISWTESAAAGLAIASRAIYYSANGGESWTLITSSPGASPHSWTIAGLPNGNQYRVRVSVTDNGSPALAHRDDSNSSFTLNVPNGDVLGPIVGAGSIAVDPNPIRAAASAALSATVSDQTTGGSNVTAAEWSSGAAAAPAGSGTAMSGGFGGITVAVSATIPPNTLAPGQVTLWVRGCDAANNWGNASSLDVFVNPGGATAVAEGAPAPFRFGLDQNAPNPFNPETSIRFVLPAETEVALAVYDVGGRLIRTLAGGKRAAGRHDMTWDGRDDRGAPVASGLYFCRLTTPAATAVRKMVMLK